MAQTELPIANQHQCCQKKGGVLFPSICVTLRWAVGGLFLVAAFNKLFIANGPQLFSEAVKAFKFFDPKSQESLIQLTTFIVPWTELIAGIALIIGFWTRAAAGVLGALLVVFIYLLLHAMRINPNMECGCFGKLSPFCPKKIGWCNIIQNSFMLVSALAIIACPRHILAVEGMFKGCCRK
jgi:uncharacterized membrane protein YphA (DoxX/SURF4 family)